MSDADDGESDGNGDGEDFVPDAVDEPEDDFDEDVVEEGDSDEDYPTSERPTTPKYNIIELDSDAQTSPALSNPTTSKRRKLDDRQQSQTPIRAFSKGGSISRVATASPLRTRGVADFTKSGGQEVRLKDLFGQRNEDLKAILLTRDHWLAQETLPLKKKGNSRRSFFENAEARDKERETTKRWYAEIGKEVFAKAQKSKVLNQETAQKYLENEGPDSLNVLFGHIDAPELFTLKQRSYVDTAQPFRDQKFRKGWLLNLGSRIQDAQWAVNEEPGTQYLAVAIEQHPIGGQQKHLDNSKAPAFAATSPFSASIQIWAFEARNDEQGTSKDPRLHMVICTDWGAPKHLRWCPYTTSHDSEPNSDVHIGVLAGIWSDGHVRLLDVSYPRELLDTSETHYLHVSQAAFDVSLPQTIPSCLHWLSGTTLAVATAAGTLAIWTFTQPDTFSSSHVGTRSPRPWFYQQVADTYIITLSSGRPSQPHFLSITTADGFARMYDIRTPNADNIASIRSRNLCITQDWHEQTQSFIMPDEHYTLKHNPVRRYYHNLYSMRANGIITRTASSSVHPSVLIGGADGRVEASNPIGRITNYKIIPWQQIWFAHEWRGPIEDQKVGVSEGGPVGEVNESGSADGSGIDVSKSIPNKSPNAVLSQPLVRISEGYKAYQPGISHSIVSKKPANPEIGKGIAIYEEQSAITVLAWNPNMNYDTWAVAGMGSGLLRVEDIGV